MRKLLSALVALTLISGPAWALDKSPAKKKEAATATKPSKPKNDPKWKNNSLAKKQAECKANPQDPKCAKKKPAKSK
jgi:hypothetical protein